MKKYGLWTGPGGRIDPGEDANEAVLREVWEEVGLKIVLLGPEGWKKTDTETNLNLVPSIYVNRHKINDVHDHSVFIFAAASESRATNPQTEADMGVECIWATQKQLDDMKENDKRFRSEVYKYASTALKLASKK